MQSERVRIAVIFGGRSNEHAISLVSAGCVMAALDPERYDVVPIGITTEGAWVAGPADPSHLRIVDRVLPTLPAGAPVVLPGDPTTGGVVALQGKEVDSRSESTAAQAVLGEVDVIFPLLHGRFGEDGTVQGLLEMAGVPYVGSGVFASAAAMDKAMTKRLLGAEGLSVGSYQVLGRSSRPAAERADEVDLDALGLPVFVKPCRSGSSVGISKVRTAEELPAALQLAFAHDHKVIVEAAVVGREIECGVLAGPGPARASVPAEIRLVRGHDWYDFEAKYLDDACEFDIPADLEPDVAERVRALACRAFEALDCAGLARVDFFLTPAGELIVNEVNTMPGFTPISMFPRMWGATGVGYAELLDVLITSALAT